MKKLLLVLVCIALATMLFVGCIPGITPTPEPEEPAPVMEAVALVESLEVEAVMAGDEVVEEGYWIIEWSIVNTGDTFIREYTLTFEVEYPDISKDYLIIELTKTYLEVGDMHSGDITLAPYGNAIPESVSVTWELYE